MRCSLSLSGAFVMVQLGKRVKDKVRKEVVSRRVMQLMHLFPDGQPRQVILERLALLDI